MTWLKFKFKERIVVVGTGIIFTILLIAETEFLSRITPIKNHKNILNKRDLNQHKLNFDSVKQTADNEEQHTAKIFEQILQNFDSHIHVMRRELSIDNDVIDKDQQGIFNETLHFSNGSNEQTTQVSDSKFKQVVANSKVAHKYADVIFKIAEILEKSSAKRKDQSFNNAKYESVDRPNSEALNDGKSDNNNGNKAAQDKVPSIYPAWPKLGVYSGNVTISHMAHPNGYMKREGKDFELSENVVMQLQGFADKLKMKHIPNNPAEWDTLNLFEDTGNLPAWQKWHNSISRYQMYPDDPDLVIELLNDLRSQKPVECYEKPKAGTQFKVFYHFENKGRALFKAIRFSREQEVLPDHYYFSDYERFNAEIAAYHLDRLLGFRRVPPAIGRIIHIKKEMQDIAVEGLEDEIFYSPAGNLCVRGRCEYYCDLHHMVCGRPYLLEGVMMAYMPSANDVDRLTWKHPWKRSYIVDTAARWENNPNYCDRVRRTFPYNEGRRLLDLMDLSVLDFLMNHMDRHHYETFEPFGNDTFILHLDNGKGFGSHREDEMTNLYPIMHCCLIRYTTYQRLVDYHKGPIHLGELLSKSMQDDPVAPVLLDPHLKAVDRRVKIVLEEIHKCTLKKNYDEVIVDDGF